MTLAIINFESIKEKWEEVTEILGNSLPSNIDFDRVKKHFEDGKLRLWYLYRDDKVVSIATTYIRLDKLTEERSLVIYTQYNYNPLINGLYEVFMGGLKKYAKKNKCIGIVRFMVEEVI